jgi:hypothetical protein
VSKRRYLNVPSHRCPTCRGRGLITEAELVAAVTAQGGQVGKKHPSVSQRSAEIRQDTRLHQTLYLLDQYGPAVADDISEVFVKTYGMERMVANTVSSRFQQLRKAHLIAKVLDHNGAVVEKLTRWGKDAEVHRITPLGDALLAKLGVPPFKKQRP